MDAPGPNTRTTGGNGAVIAGTSLVLVYLLCPVVFAVPLQLLGGLWGSHTPPAVEKAVDVFFAPIVFLHDHVPAYQMLIEKEEELLRAVWE